MAVYFSKHKGLGTPDQVTYENYKEVIIKIGISKLPEALLKGHQFFSKHYEKYPEGGSIAETMNDYLADLNTYVKSLPAKKQKAIFHTDAGYSGNKWEGKKYRQTRNLKTSEIAALIKKELEIEFEAIAKFNVRSEVYSGGSSIHVSMNNVTFNPYTEHFLNALKSGQSIEEYNQENANHYNHYRERFNEEFKALIKKTEQITNQYNFNDSDTQTDYFHVGYYSSVKFEEEEYLLKHFPDSKEAKRRKEWDDKWAKQKAASSAKAKERKGKFKKGEFVFYKAEMHKSWHKFKLSNGLYLAKIVKSPNGRAMFSNYSICILENINALNQFTLEYHKKHGTDKYYITNEYGTFYFGSVITGHEELMLSLDDPAARQALKETAAPETPKVAGPPKEITTQKKAASKKEKKQREPKAKKKARETPPLVTIDNYLHQNFDTREWPRHEQEAHKFITGETNGYKHIEMYVEDETVRAVIDLHLQKVNELLRKQQGAEAQQIILLPTAKPVTNVGLSVRFIRRYANLHGKTLTERQVANFVRTLQRAIITQQIRKTDPHAEVIKHIQDQIIETYNHLEQGGKVHFKIEGVQKYVAIGKSETELQASKLLKRYVASIGKTDKEKHRKLFNDIHNALNAGIITDIDPLYKQIGQAQRNLFVAFSRSGKLIVSTEELSGLQGLGFIPMMIAAAIGKGIEHMAHKAFTPGSNISGLGCGCDLPKATLQGIEKPKEMQALTQENNNKIMSVDEALKLKFTLIGLDGDYLKLIGKACRPTSFLIYGPGGSGKSTFTLLFANYMAHKGNRVLYAAGEQKDTPVLTEMLDRLKIKNSENFGLVKRLDGHDLSKFDIIVIDSKDSLNYELDDFIHQREKYPNLSFVILSQGTKAGGFTGTEKWRNEVDTLIYCESLMAYTNRDKNRWGGSAEIQINSLISKY